MNLVKDTNQSFKCQKYLKECKRLMKSEAFHDSHQPVLATVSYNVKYFTIFSKKTKTNKNYL